MIDEFPFPIQYGDFDDEDYAALDEYYCEPHHQRDEQKVSYIRNKYDFLLGTESNAPDSKTASSNNENDVEERN